MRGASFSASAGRGNRAREEAEKRARAGAAVGFLLGDAQQKDKQVENVGVF